MHYMFACAEGETKASQLGSGAETQEDTSDPLLWSKHMVVTDSCASVSPFANKGTQ